MAYFFFIFICFMHLCFCKNTEQSPQANRGDDPAVNTGTKNNTPNQTTLSVQSNLASALPPSAKNSITGGGGSGTSNVKPSIAKTNSNSTNSTSNTPSSADESFSIPIVESNGSSANTTAANTTTTVPTMPSSPPLKGTWECSYPSSTNTDLYFSFDTNQVKLEEIGNYNGQNVSVINISSYTFSNNIINFTSLLKSSCVLYLTGPFIYFSTALDSDNLTLKEYNVTTKESGAVFSNCKRSSTAVDLSSTKYQTGCFDDRGPNPTYTFTQNPVRDM